MTQTELIAIMSSIIMSSVMTRDKALGDIDNKAMNSYCINKAKELLEEIKNCK